MVSKIEGQNFLSSIIWDYKVDPARLREVLMGSRQKEGPFDQEKIFLRVLERLPWHDILDLPGKERVTQLLTTGTITRLR